MYIGRIIHMKEILDLNMYLEQEWPLVVIYL